MEIIFIQLAIILFTAFLVSYIIRLFKQPIVIGYIIAGMIISPFIIKFGASREIINTFSHLGIAFLLFIVGLHLNPNIVKRIGKTSFIVGIGQMVLTFGLGFLVSYYLLSFDYISSAYIGVALMFSSTIIVTKLLSDKRELDSLHGKISVGVLIIQDLVAVAVLMFISSVAGGTSSPLSIGNIFAGAGFLVFLFIIGYIILPKLTYDLAKSQELLFLFSICWCFLIASVFSYMGFSIEIGALIAGVILSISPYTSEISSKVRPLRDFFLIIFFIILGLNIQISSLGSIFINALIFSLIALIFKPIILMILMAISGHAKRNNFFVGTTLAQISEFSLIVLALGVSVGHITDEVLSTITLTAVLTIAVSTYFIIYSNNLYNSLSGKIPIFERKGARDEKETQKVYDAILFGYNRIGYGILRSLKKIKKDYLVVDFNPDTVSDLKRLRIPSVYGDVSDCEFLNDLPLDKLKLAVSTIPDFETSLVLIESIRLVNKEAIIIVRAHEIKEALKLYKAGADYVLTPHFLGGEYVSKMISKLKVNDTGYKSEREKHIRMLKDMMGKGYKHPYVEKN